MICTLCGLDKPADAFYSKANGSPERRCKVCRISRMCERAAERAGTDDGLAAQRLKSRDSARRRRRASFGLSDQDFKTMLAAFEGRCWICLEVPSGTGPNARTLHLDHDHVSGEVRGLLCTRCNSLLGMARDDLRILQRAMAYLRMSEGRSLTKRLMTVSRGA